MLTIFRRYATWRNTVLLLVAQFAVQFSILFLIYPVIGGQGFPLDMRSGLSLAGIQDYVASLGEQGRRIYVINEGTADVLYPVLYSLAYSFLLYRLLVPMTGEKSRWRMLALLPFCIAIADLLENTSIIGTLATGAVPGLWPSGVILFNTIKGFLILVSIAALGIVLCARGVVFLRRKRAEEKAVS